jgi:hypothetical protein
MTDKQRGKNCLKLLFIFLTTVFLLFCQPVFSQDRPLEVQYPEIAGVKPETVSTLLPDYVKYVFNFSIGVFGLVAFSALLWGGFLYLTSAGRPDKLKDARDRIISAFLGLVILLSSYIILTSINPQLVIFSLPYLTPPATTTTSQISQPKPSEINLIATELPLGQSIENGVWLKKTRDEIENLIKQDTDFLTEKITVDDHESGRIADLVKYLKVLTEECRCDKLKGLCTKPKNYSQTVGCSGDPCPDDVRKKIDKILGIIQEKQEKLLSLRAAIIVKKLSFENQLTIFQNIETEMLSCETQQKTLFNLNEYLSRLNFFNEQGWKMDTVSIPGAPKAQADPLTFYCTAGGNIIDYPYTLLQGAGSLEYTVPELSIQETPAELTQIPKISCPVEIPLGQVIDDLRESAILLLAKMERLADMHEKMAAELQSIPELISQCTDKNCTINCACIPNPCYQKCVYICAPFCKSPCLQAIGGCTGYCPASVLTAANQKVDDCLERKCPPEEMEKIASQIGECSDACPRPQIIFEVGKIKSIEDEIFKNISEIEQIFPKVSVLLSDQTSLKNLSNLRQGMNLCYSPDVENPSWVLLNCDSAKGNYGPDGKIISSCPPRDFFCCLLSGEQTKFPWQNAPSTEPAYYLPSQNFAPLPEGEKGCPQGYLCDPDVRNYNQYNDASQPLKELLSCMRRELNNIQKEQELTETIGRITSISDSKLYQGTCTWLGGPTQPNGCSHLYEIKYGKEVVSAHYGGPLCRNEMKSYAVDFGDEKNADYIIAAANDCWPGVYINFRTPGHYDHIHVSIGQAEDCGAN